jgi:hypothetical protein
MYSKASLLATLKRHSLQQRFHPSSIQPCFLSRNRSVSYLFWLGGVIQNSVAQQHITLCIKMGDGTNRKYGLLQDLLLIVVSVSVLGTSDLSMPRRLLTWLILSERFFILCRKKPNTFPTFRQRSRERAT